MSQYIERNAGFTGALSKCTLAEGTNASTIKTTATLEFAINGIVYTKAATDNIAMTALTAQAANTTCLYMVQINSSGTVSMTKGVEVSTTDYANGVLCELPKLTANNCPVGIIKIANTAGFTSGTTDLSAAGVTATYYDLAGLPSGRL